MRASLAIRDGPRAGTRFWTSGEALLIGRNEDNDVVLDSPHVSRYHARLAWADGVFRLEDLGSKNGTRLNRVRLDVPAPLNDGDQIQVGDVTLLFEIQGQQTMTIPGDSPRAATSLSRREAEILGLIADGRSNHEIAESLVLSVRTVERHVSNIYAKIGARNRAEATAYAISHSLAR